MNLIDKLLGCLLSLNVLVLFIFLIQKDAGAIIYLNLFGVIYFGYWLAKSK